MISISEYCNMLVNAKRYKIISESIDISNKPHLPIENAEKTLTNKIKSLYKAEATKLASIKDFSKFGGFDYRTFNYPSPDWDNGEFTNSICMLYYGSYYSALFNSNSSKYNSVIFNKFDKEAEKCMQKVKTYLESKYDWFTVELRKPDKDDIDREKNSNGGFYIVYDIIIKVTDDYASKLLGIDKSESDINNSILSKISDKEKETMYKSYDAVVNFINDPRTIDDRSNIGFQDVLAVCKIANISDSKLLSIISKGKYKEISYKDLRCDEFSADQILKITGEKIKVVFDMCDGGAGERVALVKGKLMYINLEHNQFDNISNYPYSTENFTKYFDRYPDIIKSLLKEYDNKKGYNIIN